MNTAVCEDCYLKISGYMPYFGFSCDGCLRVLLQRFKFNSQESGTDVKDRLRNKVWT